MRRFFLFLSILIAVSASAQQKREFRGAWIQCVNGQFKGLGTQRMQLTLTQQLDELQKDGVNAIIFQVRPECDALYESKYEPWSHFLTGVQGEAPVPYWDPLEWMVRECHRRGMELHAWINPYRAKTKTEHELASNHVAARYPERTFEYDGLVLLNPALAVNRNHICAIVADIVTRYDVDGLHIDDYFYPYPVAGVEIPDQADFMRNNEGFTDIGDWRRHNVDLFVEQLYNTVHALKPWVKVGISPFGIYRNRASHAGGSNTRGLQNYDDLYADVLLWIEQGWLDYCVPQLYWQIGHPSADYAELIRWWNDNASARPLFIGEDVERTVKYADPEKPTRNQLPAKRKLHSEMSGVQGTVLWYAKAVADNIGNYGTSMRNNYWRYPALQPLMPHIDSTAPRKVKRLKVLDIDGQKVLCWTAPKAKQWSDEAHKYVVYRFAKGEKANLDDASHIVAVTDNTHYELPVLPRGKYYYYVTALDRMANESTSVKVKVTAKK